MSNREVLSIEDRHVRACFVTLLADLRDVAHLKIVLEPWLRSTVKKVARPDQRFLFLHGRLSAVLTILGSGLALLVDQVALVYR